MDSQTPDTPDTRFFIGSTTKAFTATLIGMLVDDGVMDWDDPVDEHLPYFNLDVRSDEAGARATIRDLLSHRTGFPRMGMLWANGTVPSERILEQAARAEPFAPFRARFYYNNVQYLAAGWAAAAAGGETWDRLIRNRILDPLGMNDTRPLMREAIGEDSTARGYSWNERLEKVEVSPVNAGIGRATEPPRVRLSRGRVRFPQSAIEGDFRITAVGDDRIRIETDLGEFGQSVSVVDGERGWVESSSPLQPFTELTGEMFTQTLLEHPAVTFGDWRQYYDSVQVVRADQVNGRSVYLVRLESDGLPPKTLVIDSETGDILREQRVMILPAGMGSMPVTTTYEDYRDTPAGRAPFRTIESNEAMGRTIYETESVEVGIDIDPDVFRFPREDE